MFMTKNTLSPHHKGLRVFCVIIFFILAFTHVLWIQFDLLNNMPGDIGDSRLNKYFLENIYQFFKGETSLINLKFFYPYPDILGMSDNLFGSSPVYLLARLFTNNTDTAYQIWYLFGYMCNYIAAYFALRWLNISVFSAIIGALIFTFALPASAQMGHVQLHYRFGIPLSMVSFILFLENKNWRNLLATIGWGLWQFYCAIYLGVFLLLFIITIFIVYLVIRYKIQKTTFRNIFKPYLRSWKKLSLFEKNCFLIYTFLFVILLIFLFYPYIKANSLYDVTRSVLAIGSMLPKPQSYILSDESLIWSSNSKIFEIDARGENQLFIGAIPLVLIILGFICGKKKRNRFTFWLFAGSLITLIIFTLSIYHISFWYLFAKLPLFNGIRVMSRICLVMLFPVGYLCAYSIDSIAEKSEWLGWCLLSVALPLLLIEFSAIRAPVSTKISWNQRLNEKKLMIPKNLPKDPILFFAQFADLPSADLPFAEELDAMLISQTYNIPTLNGYSGYMPRYFNERYGKDCTEIPRRILAYLDFSNQLENSILYLNLMQRVVPIGFEKCNSRWWKELPSYNIIQTNKDCKETYVKVLDKLKISADSPNAKIYLYLIQFLHKTSLNKCNVHYKLEIMP